MKKLRIILTRCFPDLVHSRANCDYQATLNESDVLWQGSKLASMGEDMDGMLISSVNKFTAEVIEALPPSVRILASYSAGFDHVDLSAVKRRGITVTNTPGVMSEATADIALLLLLATARRAREGLDLARSGEWSGWAPKQLLGIHFSEKKLGIIGNGLIGQALARRARALNMEVHYHNRSRLNRDKEEGAIYHDSLNSLLTISAFLSINCELTKQTKNLLNTDTISLLPQGAVIINTSRGEVIDDDALISAIKSGKIAAAGFDVYCVEPVIDYRYQKLKNVFLLPYIGSSTYDTRNNMGFVALDNLDVFFAGKTPPHRVA